MNNTIKQNITSIINELADNPNTEGLQKTPERVAKSFEELTSGYRNETDVLNDCRKAIFNEKVQSHVSVNSIEFYSLCEHHLLPFWGTVSIAFVPHVSGKILGLSKFARIVDIYSKRFQVQERLVQNISDAITEILEPQALCVEIKAQHMCMMMRGIQKQKSKTVTYLFSGDAQHEQSLKELLRNEN